MSLPTFLKTWNFAGLNIRIPYVSLNDTMATLLYGIKSYLVTTMGATVVYSCDGTTGDATDRWASKANCTTRGANVTTANSFCVLTWAGVQFMLSYVGASDDIARISYTQDSSFVLAGTPNQTPTTPTVECIIATGISLINATTSADRVYSIQATSDRSVFRLWIYRSGALARSIGLEQLTLASGVTAGTVFGWNSTVSGTASIASTGSHGGSCATTATGNTDSFVCKVGGAARALHGGTVTFGALTSAPFAAIPEVSGKAGIFPLVVGCVVSGNTGWVGTRIDGFFGCHGAVAQGQISDDVTANTRLIWAGSMMTPWSTSAGLITA